MDGTAATNALVRTVAGDEASCCALLERHISRLGGTPSRAVGQFFDKFAKVEGLEERLAFLNKGQEWVVRGLQQDLPRIDDRVASPRPRGNARHSRAQRCGMRGRSCSRGTSALIFRCSRANSIHQLFDILADFGRKRQAVALATVIETTGSVSAQVGAKAIIDTKGKVLKGWVGGGCAQSTVREAAIGSIKHSTFRPSYTSISMTKYSEPGCLAGET